MTNTFTGDTITETTLQGIEFIGASVNDVVSNNLVHDIGGTGIKVGNSPNDHGEAAVPSFVTVTNSAGVHLLHAVSLVDRMQTAELFAYRVSKIGLAMARACRSSRWL